MKSPRYRPAGLLVIWAGHRVMLDGGGCADPTPPIEAWLVSDQRAELMSDIRRRAGELCVHAAVGVFEAGDVSVRPLPVRHTSHPTYGYLIETVHQRAAWAPEFWTFPEWAAGADMMFADAAGWDKPIRFAGGVGGHACVCDVAAVARSAGVRRLVFAHIGRPSIRAIDRGEHPPFGSWGSDGAEYRIR
jgi:beta-lactamase family protein